MSALAPGTYLCVANRGLIPWLIRTATRSRVDHCAVVVDGGMVVEAEPSDVRMRPLSEFAGEYVVANVAEPMTSAARAVVAAKAVSLVGADYNFAAIGADGAAILGLHWRILLRLAGQAHCFDCSQLVAVCGAAAGLDWACGEPVPMVTPADLALRRGVEQVTVD